MKLFNFSIDDVVRWIYHADADGRSPYGAMLCRLPGGGGTGQESTVEIGRQSQAFAVSCFAFMLAASPAWGDTLSVVENQVTFTTFYETAPSLGNDGSGDLVVYTSRELLNTGFFDQADVWYQPLLAGQAVGSPVQITSDLTDDQLNDVSGDFIVYTSFDTVDSNSGSIMLYQISTPTVPPQPIGNASFVREPKIHGNYVVWREGGVVSSQVMIYDLSDSSATAQPLTGATIATFNVEIGDRFVVWSELDGDFDIAGFDLTTGQRLVITGTGGTNERQPSTSGSWVVWQAQDIGDTGKRLEAYDLDALPTDPNAFRSVVDDGAINNRPSIDGDLIAYESNVTGDFDVYVYRLSTEETFAVTVDPENQYLNDIYGGLVAYVDRRNGDEDIYVANLTFIAPDPLADLSVTKTDSPDPVTVGSNLTYTLTVANNGPSAATGVTLTDTLPATVTSVSATPTQGNCTSPSPITCDLGTLTNGASATVTIVVTPTAEGGIGNTANVTGNEIDPDETNNSVTETTTVTILPSGDSEIPPDGLSDPFEEGFCSAGIKITNVDTADTGSSTGSAASGSTIASGELTVIFPPGTACALDTTEIEIEFVSNAQGPGVNPAVEITGVSLPAGTTKTVEMPFGDQNAVCIDDQPNAEIETILVGGCVSPKVQIPIPDLVGATAVDTTYTVTRISDTKIRIEGLVHTAIVTVLVKPTLIRLSSFTATEDDGQVLLEWTTGSEIDNEGFNILRSEDEDGPYSKINNTLIPAKAISPGGADYEFVDTTVEDGETYFYKLEDIDTRGISTLHGPIEITVIEGETSSLDISNETETVAAVTDEEASSLDSSSDSDSFFGCGFIKPTGKMRPPDHSEMAGTLLMLFSPLLVILTRRWARMVKSTPQLKF